MRFVLAVAACLVLTATPASAGEPTNRLSRCVSEKMTAEDRGHLMRWLFSSFSRNNAVASLAIIPDAEREKVDRAVAAFFDKAILVDCRSEAVNALKADGTAAPVNVTVLLGTTAGADLGVAPEVQSENGRFAHHIDRAEWIELQSEAGVDLSLDAATGKPQ